jgi:hypothetical protein
MAMGGLERGGWRVGGQTDWEERIGLYFGGVNDPTSLITGTAYEASYKQAPLLFFCATIRSMVRNLPS